MTDDNGIQLKRKILIMGLPGSGKTTIAELLVPRLKAVWFNADAVRQEINKDLGFDQEARLEHARRMGVMCDFATKYGGYAVADFVCPTKKARTKFNPDFVIWVNRIQEGRFADTNKMFEPPTGYADVVLEDGHTPEQWLEQIMNALEGERWDNQAPTALLIGRYQPFHDGHKALVAEAIRRTGQVCIALRDVGGIDDSNPYDFPQVRTNILAGCREFGDKVRVIEIPNIMDVFYGRGVGYNIEMLELSDSLKSISATKVRAGEIDIHGNKIEDRPPGYNPMTGTAGHPGDDKQN
jgi:adenylylsulfate kinase